MRYTDSPGPEWYAPRDVDETAVLDATGVLCEPDVLDEPPVLSEPLTISHGWLTWTQIA